MAPLHRLLASIGLILALDPTQLSASAISCGATITKDTVLTADLSCDCSKNFLHLLLVKGPATLDLNGRTVKCSDTSVSRSYTTACIAIGSKGATIKNGIVKGCGYGVTDHYVAPAEGARIENIIAKETLSTCFKIRGDNCILRNVIADGDGIYVIGNNNKVEGSSLINSFSGVSILGDNNTVISNTISDVTEDCVSLLGVGNAFKKNTVRRCGGYGVQVDGSKSIIALNTIEVTGRESIQARATVWISEHTGIRIAGNRISGSSASGIAIGRSFNKTVVENNLVVDCIENGIALYPTSNHGTVKNNTIQNCGCTGLIVFASCANTLTCNTITDCKVGIEAKKDSKRNRFINNRVSDSALIGLKDMSAKCGSNVWKGNTGKGNIPCTTTK
ncbi:hypothetical protein MHU86_22448 [Fragilaria crotonensis]|nr:hypothetical protein MHU86_22448 [Fragilaria crotonensis]